MIENLPGRCPDAPKTREEALERCPWLTTPQAWQCGDCPLRDWHNEEDTDYHEGGEEE